MRNHTRAFTLLDLLVSITVLASLAAIAAPTYKAVLQEQEMRQTVNRLIASTVLARSEAAKRNRAVVVRARNSNWSDGWDVFVDLNNNTLLDIDEPVISQQAGSTQIIITGNTPVARYIRLTPTGRAKLPGGGFQAGTLTLCHRENMLDQRQLILSATGRIRSERAAPSNGC